MHTPDSALFRKALEITTQIEQIDAKLHQLLTGAGSSSGATSLRDLSDREGKAPRKKARKEGAISKKSAARATEKSDLVTSEASHISPEHTSSNQEGRAADSFSSPELLLTDDSGEEQLALVPEPLISASSKEACENGGSDQEQQGDSQNCHGNQEERTAGESTIAESSLPPAEHKEETGTSCSVQF